jgi:cytochrome c oxidase subunit II
VLGKKEAGWSMLNFPLFPVEASTIAGHVDALMLFVFLVALFFASLIALLIIFFAVRYHHGSHADRSNPSHSNLAIELIWTGIPLVIVLGIYVWGAQVYVRMSQPPANAITMYVVGKQWMWKMQHPEGRREINELHIPVGYPIRLLMTSEDVIHSFFVPAFRVKQDVLPGRYTSVWFQATEAGDYHLFCAQYCGTSHSGMVGKIIAMTPPNYERWLSGASATAPAGAPAVPAASGGAPMSGGGPVLRALNPTMVTAGASLFKDFKCGDCHKSDNSGKGPPLEGLFGHKVDLEGGQAVVADEGYIRESILNPNAKVAKGYKPLMPTFQGQLEEEEILQLITYVESLKGSK